MIEKRLEIIKMKIAFLANSELYHVDVPPLKRLLDVLHEDLRLIGSKEGCGEGACSVFINGEVDLDYFPKRFILE